MSSKYGDMVALLEWAMKQKEPRITKKRRVKDVPLEDLNLVELLRRKQNEAKMLADFLNDHEKLHKKEEAKKNQGISIERFSMLLVATFPITGPLYYFWLMNMFRAAGLK